MKTVVAAGAAQANNVSRFVSLPCETYADPALHPKTVAATLISAFV